MNNMSAIINMSNIHFNKIHAPSFAETPILRKVSDVCSTPNCFKIPKPIPSSTQPGGKARYGKYIQNTLGPIAHRHTKKSFTKINVNHFNSFEGAPYGFGASPKNNII